MGRGKARIQWWGVLGLAEVSVLKTSTRDKSSDGGIGEFGASFHVCRRGVRDEADAWVEGKAQGVLGGLQVCAHQPSTRYTRSERGMGEFGVSYHVCRRGMRNEADT